MNETNNFILYGHFVQTTKSDTQDQLLKSTACAIITYVPWYRALAWKTLDLKHQANTQSRVYKTNIQTQGVKSCRDDGEMTLICDKYIWTSKHKKH
jgi:hypothetical protein